MAQFTHKGININVNDHGRFVCEIEGTAYAEDTLLALQGKIDRQLKAKVEIAKAEPLALAVVGLARETSTYTPRFRSGIGTVTGINRTTGNISIKADGLDKNLAWDVVLVDTPENRAIVEEMAHLSNRLGEVRRAVEKNGIKASRALGNIPHERYAEIVAALQDEYRRRADAQPLPYLPVGAQ